MVSDIVHGQNFAGKVKSDASRMIYYTLQQSFRQCRAFHDLVGDLSDAQVETDFINMVRAQSLRWSAC